MKYCFPFVILLFVLNATLKANDSVPIFHLSIQNGLSNNSIRCVYQDSKGFIWFGTYDGLNRYDGSEFKIFRNRLSDSTSIPHNYIYTIHEDITHNLWVGTGQGLATYNANSSKFSPVGYYLYQSKKLSKSPFNANALASDTNGNVFIATNGWGLFVKQSKNSFAQQIPFFDGKKTLTDYNVRAICVSKNKIWLLILDFGLCTYDIKTGKIEVANNELLSSNCILPDKNGNLWLGTDKGLYQYNIAANRYIAQYQATANQLSSPQVTSLSFDAKNELWIGTDGGGINILNPQTHSFKYILPEEGKHKLTSESVYSILCDKEARMWIGTLKGGINIVDNQKNQFTTISHNPLLTNTLTSNFIYTFCEDNNHNILVGTDGGGLSVWNRKTNRFTNYKHVNGNSNALSHNSITSIKQDYLGNIWIATFGGGINKFNTTNGSFEHYTCNNAQAGIENTNVWLLYENKEHELWATTFSRGRLYKFNRGLNKFEVFNQEFENLVSLFEDSDGNFWGGSSSHLIKIDKANKHHQYYLVGKPVRAIYEDKMHRLWLGSEGGGLILFDSKINKIVERFSDADGLCNNAVLNIKEDAGGNLWLSTFNGLSKFNPTTKKFTNFYQSDGLQSNQFSYNAALKLSTGELLFGGISGFNLFSPEKITVRSYMPSLFITDVFVNNKPVADIDGYIKEVDNVRIKEIEIPYNEAVLSFRFNALEYSSPEKILYAYYLDGWDKTWNYTGNTKNINYNNIAEGHYMLHIKSTNSNGEWNTQEATLKITILPPWYRTWWAYLIYSLIIASLVYVYIKYKAQQAALKYKVKVAQLNAEKEREINENRQAFFTNITHEFRTPLTLIINPIKDILEKDKENAEKSELSFVYRNARRLLSLVDQLLLFKKTESDTGILQVARMNFSHLCRETFLYFAQQAKIKNITYSFSCDNDAIEIYGDKEKLEIVFYNLLSNALKYTPENSNISFKVTETASEIKVEVSDNGQGIPAHIGNKLFEKYYQVHEVNRPAKPGFGIGLYLVKQFVEKHRGSITYTSNIGTGTTFSIVLLKGAAHFGNIEISQATTQEPQLFDEIIAGSDVINDISPVTTNGLESIISEKKSILITDDNAQMRTYLAQIFASDFIVHEAENGDEGLKLAKDVQPDIIISDVVMQVMSGIDFCRAVKETASLSHIPFILLTGSASSESKLKGLEFGADDYIAKPFEKDLLVARVQNLLRNQQNLQKYFYNEITHQKHTLNISGEYKEFLEACIQIVEKHLDNDDFNIQLFAKEIGMSHSKLYKKIKTISGQSANAFIRFIRLRKAAEMFINTNYNINETAFYVGIKDIKYFREQFYKTFGLKPSEYIEKYRKTLGKNYKLNEKVKREKDTL